MTHDVTRWHAYPHPALRNSGDTVRAHTDRVKALARDLCAYIGEPYTEALDTAIENHDLPYERIMGDWPATLTRKYPLARLAKRVLEWQIRRAHWIPKPKLTRREAQILALCDKLDAVLWARGALRGDLGYFHGAFGGDQDLCADIAAAISGGAHAWLMAK